MTNYVQKPADAKLSNRSIGLNEKYFTEWIRFEDYEIQHITNSKSKNTSYIKPVNGDKFEIYNPFDYSEKLLIDTLRLGDSYRLYQKEMKERNLNAYRKRKTNKMWQDLLQQMTDFSKKYGLLGFMNSATHNRNVIGDKEILITERNGLGINKKILLGDEYLQLFTPFVEDGDIEISEYKGSVYLVKYEDTPRYYGKRPAVIDLIFSSYYAENIEWILHYAAMLSKHFDQLMTYKTSSSMMLQPVTILADAFEATKIGFTIIQDRETKIAWEFDSLKTTIQTIYAFALTDLDTSLKRCEHCKGFYIAKSNKEKYCGSACRNRHNVMNTRKRIKYENTHNE